VRLRRPVFGSSCAKPLLAPTRIPAAELILKTPAGSSPLYGRDWVRYPKDGSKEPGPRNRRAEMWGRLRDWLKAAGGADIPDLDSLHADVCGPGYSYDMNQRLLLESKEHMRARGIRSPDEGDAVCLTFAEPVKSSQWTISKPISESQYRNTSHVEERSHIPSNHHWLLQIR
jgi:hypothetical protein